MKKIGFLTISKKDIIVVLGLIACVLLIIAAVKLDRYNDYRNAVKNLEDGKYEEAFRSFRAMKDYKDSEQKAQEAKQAILKNAKVGDTVYFGSYKMSKDGDSYKNEDIAWTVLETADGKALLISNRILDYTCWAKHETTSAPVTYEDSALRNFLNKTFFADAFSEEEQRRILSTVVSADRESHQDRFRDEVAPDQFIPENDTVDKVFILSMTEANRYFESDRERGNTTYTSYVKHVNVETEPKLMHTTSDMECGSWWLRTRITAKSGDYYHTWVNETGRIERSYSGNHGIRPVIRILTDGLED